MSHSHLTIDGLLKDESFISYCTRKDEKDILYWENYIKEHPAAKEIIEEAQQEYQLLFTALATTDLDEQLKMLKKKVEAADVTATAINTARKYRTSFFRRYRYAVAAAAVVILTTGYFIWNKQQPAKTQGLVAQQYSSKPGERKNFQLPDGTQVTLNSGSEITVNETYGQATRDVYLKGEAFFEVQHNKQVPFIVHTDDMDVKALGTAFNVKSYDEEKKSEAVLIRGLVEVTLKKDNNRKVLLHPDEKVFWSMQGPKEKKGIPEVKTADDKGIIKPIKKMDDGSIKELAWVENNLAFNDEALEDIAVQLSRWYGVTIRFDSEEVKQFHFTGTFKKEKIERVLDILKSSKTFHYRFDGQETIVIGN